MDPTRQLLTLVAEQVVRSAAVRQRIRDLFANTYTRVLTTCGSLGRTSAAQHPRATFPPGNAWLVTPSAGNNSLHTTEAPTPMPDHRAPTRRPDPICPACTIQNVRVTLRTTMVVYYRCDNCGYIWVDQKPLPASPVS